MLGTSGGGIALSAFGGSAVLSATASWALTAALIGLYVSRRSGRFFQGVPDSPLRK